MFGNNDLGASLYETWNDKQRREEIAKLVEGYRNGLPVGILCKMTEAVAGNRKKARRYLRELLTSEERKAAIDKETGGIQVTVREFFG
jgi:hypothetical protein